MSYTHPPPPTPRPKSPKNRTESFFPADFRPFFWGGGGGGLKTPKKALSCANSPFKGKNPQISIDIWLPPTSCLLRDLKRRLRRTPCVLPSFPSIHGCDSSNRQEAALRPSFFWSTAPAPYSQGRAYTELSYSIFENNREGPAHHKKNYSYA